MMFIIYKIIIIINYKLMNILNKGINFYTKNKRKIDPHLTFLGAYLTTKFLIRRARAILSTLTMK